MPAQIEAEVEVDSSELNSVESRLQEMDGREVGVKVTASGIGSTQRRINSINGTSVNVNAYLNRRDIDDELEALKNENHSVKISAKPEGLDLDEKEQDIIQRVKESSTKDDLSGYEPDDLTRKIRQTAIKDDDFDIKDFPKKRIRNIAGEVAYDGDFGGVRASLDDVTESRNVGVRASGDVASIRANTQPASNEIDGFISETKDKFDREGINEVKLGVSVDGEELASAEAALNRVARDRSTTIDVDQDGTLTATLGRGGSGTPSFNSNPLSMPSAEDGELFPNGIPGGKSNPGRLTWSQLSDIGTQPGYASGIPQQQARMRNQLRGVPQMGDINPQIRKPDGTLKRVNNAGISGADFLSGGIENLKGNRQDGFLTGKMKNSAEKLKESLSDATLSMSQLYNLFAALLPVLASVAAQAMGVAVAFGAIAGAGATLVAGGLLAQGNDLQSSIQQTKEDLSELKTELYDVFRGPMSEMSSFANQWLDQLPKRMEPLAEAMGGATAFQGLFDQMTVDVINGIASAITILNNKVEKIGDIYQDLAGPLGSTLLKGLGWLIDQAHENRNVLKGLGGSLLAIGAAIYNVGELIGRVMSRLQWFFKMMGGIVSLLNNRLIGTLLSTITMFGLLAKFIGMVSTILGGLWTTVLGVAKAWGMMTAMIEAFMSKAILTKISSIIAAITGLNFTLMQTAALVAAITGGLALLGAGVAFGGLGPSGFGGGGFGKDGPGVGGPTPSGPSQRPHSMEAPGGSGNEVNIHLNGQTTDKQIDKIERVTRATINDEKQISEQR